MKNLIIFIVLLSFFSCRSVKRDIVVDRQDETIISIKKDSVLILTLFDLKTLTEFKNIKINTFDTFDSAGSVIFKPVTISITENKEQLILNGNTYTLATNETKDTSITTKENIKTNETKSSVKFSFIKYFIIFVLIVLVVGYVLLKLKFI